VLIEKGGAPLSPEVLKSPDDFSEWLRTTVEAHEREESASTRGQLNLSSERIDTCLVAVELRLEAGRRSCPATSIRFSVYLPRSLGSARDDVDAVAVELCLDTEQTELPGCRMSISPGKTESPRISICMTIGG
jgi:hypothetical protein